MGFLDVPQRLYSCSLGFWSACLSDVPGKLTVGVRFTTLDNHQANKIITNDLLLFAFNVFITMKCFVF